MTPSIRLSQEEWRTLENTTVFFSHQSVGENILDGVRTLQQNRGGGEWAIVETDKPANMVQPMLAHAELGRNGDPHSKIDAFVNAMEGGLGDKVDIALFKLCFVDITGGTDVQKVFRHYKQAFAELERKYPGVRFVRTTAPLTVYPEGMTSRLKRAIGLAVADDEDNVKRNEFNRLVHEEYDGQAPIFDIAAGESTLEDGRRTTFVYHGKTDFHLASEYASDNGHLNVVGQRQVAERMLLVLSGVAPKRPGS